MERKEKRKHRVKKMKFRIRVDDVNNVRRDVTQWASGISRERLVVHHMVNTNSHFHLYLDSPMIMSPQAMRYKIRTYFELKPVQYSVGVCDPERTHEYLQYLFNTKHGNVATVHSTTFEDHQICEWQAKADVVSEEFKTKTKKPTTLFEMAREVHETTKTDDVSEVMRMVLKVLHKYCKCHDRYLAIKVMDTAMYMKDPEYILSKYLA